MRALNAFVRTHVTFTSSHRQRWLLARLEFRCLDTQQQQLIQTLRDGVAQRLRHIIESGITQRCFIAVYVIALIPRMLSMFNELGSWHCPGSALPLSATVGLHTKMIHALSPPAAG
ncbi:hypothetical protein HX862_28675 [Pseudomonas sp. D5002]|uniref:hypothetical protein n=1 Tax=Pseudomonas sp. D5002 TaxID=2738818 RepID=UPI0015A39551|nr:hypothetical protein [Pseudomonas sp. D5002]NWB11916.1 hypothetical protein [Pseudomonas sp. D5002]